MRVAALSLLSHRPRWLNGNYLKASLRQPSRITAGACADIEGKRTVGRRETRKQGTVNVRQRISAWK